MLSYLIAVAVGPYVALEQRAPKGSKAPIRNYVYRWSEAAGTKDFEEVPAMVECFEQWLGPYPFAKVSLVQTATRFGGMENAGCVFLNEGLVNGSGHIADTVSHEIAHQWF